MNEHTYAMLKLVERTAKGKTNSGEAFVKVARLMDSDNIEGYLLTFEHKVAAYEIDQSRWAFILAPQLTGRAQKAYMALANDEASDYPYHQHNTQHQQTNDPNNNQHQNPTVF